MGVQNSSQIYAIRLAFGILYLVYCICSSMGLAKCENKTEWERCDADTFHVESKMGQKTEIGRLLVRVCILLTLLTVGC